MVHTVDSLRAFEAKVAMEMNAGKIPYPVHLEYGSEESLLTIFKRIKKEDWVLCSWRSHYKCLLKGVTEGELMWSIRNGRSIALSFPRHRILSSAIVGGVIPIAVGIAMANKRMERPERVHCFVGDMTSNTGIFAESFRYACGLDLKMSFYVEDNGISVCTPTKEVTPSDYSDNVELLEYQYSSIYPHCGASVRTPF